MIFDVVNLIFVLLVKSYLLHFFLILSLYVYKFSRLYYYVVLTGIPSGNVMDRGIKK